MSRLLSANYIFPVSSEPLKNGIIEIDDGGIILNVIDTHGQLKESANIEFYNGILVPGFVNAHCHLELSHLKDKFPKNTKLEGFIKNIFSLRHAEESEIISSAVAADAELQQNGVVAVGDISNNHLTFNIKKNSSIFYHTFIEVFSPDSTKAEERINSGALLLQQACDLQLSASLSPNAPYSMSVKLFNLLEDEMKKTTLPVSLHNQESDEENKLYKYGQGKLYELFISMGFDMQSLCSGYNSLQSVSKFLPVLNNILLVHNTYTTEADINEISKLFENLFFVLCPNSNLFIESHLPDIEMMYRKGLSIAIGTDSYSSNDTLSILDELKTITRHFSTISLETLIKWATLNGAKALDCDFMIGSIEKGKQPGINLLTGIDFEKMKITDYTCIRKIS